jgi:hypothetical protein
MSEQAPDGFHPHSDEQDPAPDPAARSAETVRTGVPSVDRILEDLATIDALPLEEHVTAFEHAHDALRSALDAAPDASPEASPSDVA